MSADVGRVLLIDTCGAVSSVALAVGGAIVSVNAIAERRASAELLQVIEDALRAAGWALADLEAVGVVAGPGSFTGMRVGLAAAKGLCEGLGVPMAAVSRLEVLWECARDGDWVDLDSMVVGSMDVGSMDVGSMDVGSMDVGSMDAGSMDVGSMVVGSMDAGSMVVALDAGRGEVFVRGADGEERIVGAGDLVAERDGRARVVVCEEKLAEAMGGARLIAIDAASALGAVRRRLVAGGSDVALTDANYVRGEAQMYRAKAGA